MAKFTMYADIFPGLDVNQWGLGATTKPMGKVPSGGKRIAFDVVIPDEILYNVTDYAAEVSQVRVVEENNEQ